MAEEPLSREAAVGILMAQAEEPQEQQPVEAQAPAAETEAEPNPAEEIEAEAEEATGDDLEQEAEAEAAPLDAPKYWDAEDKAWFASLTPEQQAVIVKQEDKRETVVAKSKAEAAEAKKAAEAEFENLKTLIAPLQELLPQAVETFKSRWGGDNPDWSKVVEEYGAEQTLKFQAQFAAEKQQLQDLAQANAQAQNVATQNFIRQQAEKLAELAPELAESQDRKKELAGFLLKNGATEADLALIPAWAAALAFDGMKYRNGLAEAKAQAAKPKPAGKPGVKPSAQPLPQQERVAQQLRNRLNQTGSREDAVAYLLAKGL